MTPHALLKPARLAGTSVLRCQTDERLVDLTRAGHEAAFRTIVERHQPAMLRYAERLVAWDRAEDVVQQAFASAHRALLEGDGPLDLRPWLYRIVHNGCISALRRRGFDHSELFADHEAAGAVEELIEQRERLRLVMDAIGELPEGQRTAIVLRALAGRSHEEIAAELGVTGGAARQLLHRARTSLRTAATAVTPPALLPRLLPGGLGPMGSERVAELALTGSAAAITAKVCLTVAAGGAVLGLIGPAPTGADRAKPGNAPGAAAVAAGASVGADPAASGLPAGAGALAFRSEEREIGRDGSRAGERDGAGGRGTGDGDALDDDLGDDSEETGGGDSGSGSGDAPGSSGPGSGGDDNSDSSGSGDDDDDSDSSGPGSGDDSDGDDDDSDSSGPGSGGDEDDSDSSGPGSGDDEDDSDSSGPGSGDDEDDSDSSGPGSGDDDDGSDSDSDNSGSGSGDDDSDNSGSGSGDDDDSDSSSSGSGDDDDSDSSSSGSHDDD